MSDEKTKTTLGLTEVSKNTIGTMMESGYFEDQKDAAKFALAIAIREKISLEVVTGTNTVWNIGTFDPKGDLRDLVLTIYDEVDSPYKSIEFLINRGLDFIGAQITRKSTFDLKTLIDKYQ